MVFTVVALLYVIIIVLVVVFIVWFIRTLNEIKHSLLRIEMKMMGDDPVTGDSDGRSGGWDGRSGGAILILL
ncbi:MAG: hypothetical protein LBO70_02810 [Clostridiales Family XIII bacterium]|nr:hypothetical protein [Clostridiales Family XIII bacterium]